MPDFGILYVATGERIRAELYGSIKSLRSIHPDFHVTLFSDTDEFRGSELFDEIRIIDEPDFSYIDKILPLIDSPYKHTLFLDSDTFIVNSLNPAIELLDEFDFAVALEPKPKFLTYPSKVPKSFPEYNTGVMAFRKTNEVNDFFRRWHECYKEWKLNIPGTTHDQTAFREVFYFSKLRFATLPQQYNLRTLYLSLLPRNLETAVVHDRAFNPKTFEYLKGDKYEKLVVPNTRLLDQNRLVVFGRGGGIYSSIISSLTKFCRLLKR